MGDGSGAYYALRRARELVSLTLGRRASRKIEHRTTTGLQVVAHIQFLWPVLVTELVSVAVSRLAFQKKHATPPPSPLPLSPGAVKPMISYHGPSRVLLYASCDAHCDDSFVMILGRHPQLFCTHEPPNTMPHILSHSVLVTHHPAPPFHALPRSVLPCTALPCISSHFIALPLHGCASVPPSLCLPLRATPSSCRWPSSSRA